MSVLTNSRERDRFLRFLLVGVVGAVVDFGTFNLLAYGVGIPAAWASVGSFMAAIVSNFLWNRYWTYPDSRSKPVVQQVVQYTLISAIGLVIRTPVFVGLEGPLRGLFIAAHMPERSLFNPDFLGHNLALAIAVVVVMFWNFFVNRHWTYNDVA